MTDEQNLLARNASRFGPIIYIHAQLLLPHTCDFLEHSLICGIILPVNFVQGEYHGNQQKVVKRL